MNNEKKAIELILALRGSAAEVLESLLTSCRNNYEDLMVALQRKYGGDHKQELYRMELRGRVEKVSETLQDFAMEIERLVQLIYPGENHPLSEQFKVEAFVNDIRDSDIKHTVCAKRNASFTETIAYALDQETAKVISRPQCSKVRKLDVTAAGKNLVEVIKEVVKHALEEHQRKTKAKYFN